MMMVATRRKDLGLNCCCTGPKSKRKVESIGDDDDGDEAQPFELDSSDLASNDGDDDFLRDVVIAAKSSEQAQRKKKAASRPVLDGVRVSLFWMHMREIVS